MDNGIVEVLRYIRGAYGEEVFYNFGRAKNLLSDLCPQMKQERIQATNFIELNGYFMLKYAGGAYPVVHSKLVSVYMSTYRVDEDTARWIVDIFAALVGHITDEGITQPTAGVTEAPVNEALAAHGHAELRTSVARLIDGYKSQATVKEARVLSSPTDTKTRTQAYKPAPTHFTYAPAASVKVNHSLIAADFHTVAIRRDGTVAATGYNNAGQCNIWHWSDIVSVAAGNSYTVGLRSDGTVVAAGLNDHGQCDVGRWRDIIAISAGARHTLGLRRDGSVVATGENRFGECNVTGWRNITTIIAGNQCTYAIKKDRKVLARGYSKTVEYDVSCLANIVSIADANPHGALALRADGTVVKARRPMKGDFKSICNTEAIVATPDCFIGLRKDGTVRIFAYYWESSGVECSTDEWTGITAIAAGRYHVLGLRRDGTLQAAMLHTDPGLDRGQCDVGQWYELRV